MLDGLHVLPPKHDDNMPYARVVPRAMEGFLVIVHKSFERFLLHQPPTIVELWWMRIRRPRLQGGWKLYAKAELRFHYLWLSLLDRLISSRRQPHLDLIKSLWRLCNSFDDDAVNPIGFVFGSHARHIGLVSYLRWTKIGCASMHLSLWQQQDMNAMQLCNN